MATDNLAEHPAMKLISSLIASEGGGSLDELFKQLGAQQQTAQRDATGAGQQLQQAQAAPQEQPNVALDSIIRGLGQAASSAGGNQGGVEAATRLQEDERKTLMAKRAENLARLSEAYKRAADRAERIGDLENEIKLRAKMEQVIENRRAIHEQAGRVAADDMAKTREAASDTRQATRESAHDVRAAQAAKNVQASQDAAAERRAWLAAGFNPDTKEPLPTAGGKYRGRNNTALKWSTLNMMGDDWNKMVEQSQRKSFGGMGTTIDRKELRSRVFNGGMPPPEEWRDNPQAYGRYIAGLVDPSKPDQLLFPVDKRTKKSLFDERIHDLVKRYYPDAEF